MSGTRRPMGRQPVTVAGPRQIYTAFPILPLPCGNGHLRRYLMRLLKGLRWILSRVLRSKSSLASTYFSCEVCFLRSTLARYFSSNS